MPTVSSGGLIMWSSQPGGGGVVKYIKYDVSSDWRFQPPIPCFSQEGHPPQQWFCPSCWSLPGLHSLQPQNQLLRCSSACLEILALPVIVSFPVQGTTGYWVFTIFQANPSGQISFEMGFWRSLNRLFGIEISGKGKTCRRACCLWKNECYLVRMVPWSKMHGKGYLLRALPALVTNKQQTIIPHTSSYLTNLQTKKNTRALIFVYIEHHLHPLIGETGFSITRWLTISTLQIASCRSSRSRRSSCCSSLEVALARWHE